MHILCPSTDSQVTSTKTQVIKDNTADVPSMWIAFAVTGVLCISTISGIFVFIIVIMKKKKQNPVCSLTCTHIHTHTHTRACRRVVRGCLPLCTSMHR